MSEPDEQLLSERIGRELAALPNIPAPRTLSPRVMAAIAARRQAPWWRKSWAEWPVAMRVSFLAVGLVVAGFLVFAGMQISLVDEVGPWLSSATSGWFSGAAPYLDLVSRTAGAVLAVVRAAPPHLLWLCAAVIGLGYATCVGLGTLGYRLALNRI